MRSLTLHETVASALLLLISMAAPARLYAQGPTLFQPRYSQIPDSGFPGPQAPPHSSSDIPPAVPAEPVSAGAYVPPPAADGSVTPLFTTFGPGPQEPTPLPMAGGHSVPPADPNGLVPIPEGGEQIFTEIPYDGMYNPSASPLFEPMMEDPLLNECPHWSPLASLFGYTDWCQQNVGVGHERVIYAPMYIDISQPLNSTSLRYDYGFGVQTPNRSEYFFAAPPKGPGTFPQSINYQDFMLRLEAAGAKFSMTTELPLRMVDNGGWTGGFGNMNLTTKMVLIDGKRLQLTQLFRSYMMTGAASRGMGNGHFSMEPGLLARYQWTPETYIHGEATFWFPIAGTPGSSGNVLRYALGVSHVAYETDKFAILPTLEFVNWTYLSGKKTLPSGTAVQVNGETAFNIFPGVRFVLGPPGDLGLLELGISGGAGIGSNRFADGMFRVDLRWSY